MSPVTHQDGPTNDSGRAMEPKGSPIGVLEPSHAASSLPKLSLWGCSFTEAPAVCLDTSTCIQSFRVAARVPCEA